MSTDLTNAIAQHQAAFGLDLSSEALARFEKYYAMLREHNPILHLIGPMDAEEFAVRHILESLTLLSHLPDKTRFADIGSGGGLPAIPCLLAREDLHCVLIESKEKKSRFLEIVVNGLGLSDRTQVKTRQFHEVDPGNSTHITCRALDKFTERLPRLLKWRKRRQLLLFGGPNLREALMAEKVVFTEKLMPLSEQRYLFVVNR